jgi:alpha-D-xyloside xylohydrolase
MKFTKGYWMNLPDVKNYDMTQIREVKAEKDRVYIYAVPYREDVRGMGGPVLEMYLSSPQPDIIRTEAWHFMGSNQKDPKFELEDKHCDINYEETEDGFRITSGDTSLVVKKNPALFTYYYKGKKITGIGNKFGCSMISTMLTPKGTFMRGQLDLDIDEKVYGLGERFTPFVKNGQTIDMWNEDGGTCTEISYKNIPFYITNKNYGVFVNSSDKVSYEICSEMVTRVQFSVPGEKLDYMVIGGNSMENVLENYTNLTGKPALPPAWTFGLWLTSSFTTSYDEKTVNSFVDGMAERDIPLKVFHFDCFWMKENEWCNFDWDKNMFTDATGMLKRMKAKGLKICVWINSYIGQKSPLFKEAKEKGYLLKRPNGDVWQWDMWQAGMGLVDFTNPDAYKWYQSKLRVLLEQGVDCFKTDFGERIPTDAVYFDGSDPVKMHNYYTYLYNKCVFELLEEVKGKNEACLFARSATVGGQKFPVHWGGDCSSNYSSMGESLRGGLSLCMSGFGFWSHDISGFEGTAPADVYKRWAAFGLLSSHSRLHGSNSYRVPWLFGEEAVDVVRYFAKLKNTLMPYLYNAAVIAHRRGIPMMRSMVLEFTEDPCCDTLDHQYMLGRDLLVAPVFRENGDVDYYLPKGTWTNVLNGKKVIGGAWQHENHGFMSLPLMARENSIIPFGSCENDCEYDYVNGTTLETFELSDKASCDVCDMKGYRLLTVNAEKVDGKVTFKFTGTAKNLKILMRNVENVSDVQGAEAEKTEKGLLLKVNSELSEVSFRD